MPKKAALEIKKSSIHGYGVFTREPLKKGQFIAELQGSRVSYGSQIHGQSNRYGDWIGIGKNTWIDPIDEFQYLNHSCNPTAGFKGYRKLKLHALKDLHPGEEITIDYATTEDDIDFCFENNEELHEHHRKFVGPVQSLPIEVYKRYLPFIPTYFKRVYEKDILSKHDSQNADS